MNDDTGWDRMTDAIEAKFGLVDHGRSTRPIEDARELTEKVAFIVFEKGGERFKLERVTGPAIVNRRTIGSHRIGSDVRFENVYDPDEIVHHTNLYRFEDDEWVSVDPSALEL